MDFRYEKKIYYSQDQLRRIEALIAIHPSAFSEIFSERRINSVYFDDQNFSAYIDSVEGAHTRKKYRIRWYGDRLKKENFNLEIKGKIGDVGYKKVFKIDKIETELPLRKTLLAEIIKNLSIEKEFRQEEIYNFHPLILCSYKRKYFISKCGLVRVTLDKDISYGRVNSHYSLSRISKINYNNIVLEIKFSNQLNISSILEKNGFEAESTRFSKYTNGVDLIFA